MKQDMKEGLIKVKDVIGIIFALVKSFFLAITQVAWGLVSIFAFNGLITYLYMAQKLDVPSAINPLFLKMEMFISSNVVIFVGVIFALYAYFEIKEVLK